MDRAAGGILDAMDEEGLTGSSLIVWELCTNPASRVGTALPNQYGPLGLCPAEQEFVRERLDLGAFSEREASVFDLVEELAGSTAGDLVGRLIRPKLPNPRRSPTSSLGRRAIHHASIPAPSASRVPVLPWKVSHCLLGPQRPHSGQALLAIGNAVVIGELAGGSFGGAARSPIASSIVALGSKRTVGSRAPGAPRAPLVG